MTLVQTEPKKITMRTPSKLPAEYQEVEYIQSSGTQYIAPGITASVNDTLKFEADIYIMGNGCIYGQFTTASVGNENIFQVGIENGAFFARMNAQNSGTLPTTWTPSTYTVNTRYNVVSEGTTNINMKAPYLLAQNDRNGPSRYMSAKLYSFKIWLNGALVRNLVPCYRKSDSVIGMYDLVNDVFYTNAGTGTFTKGNDVNSADTNIKRVTIRPNGTEKQIRPDTGWQPGANTLLYLPFTSDMLDHSGNNRVVTTDIGIIQNGYFYNDNTDTNSRGFTIQNMPALTNFTTTFYEKKTGTYANNQQAVFLYSGGSKIHSIDFATAIRFGVWGWPNDPSVPNNGADVWRLLTYVKNGNNFSFYINATLISSASRTGVSQPAGDHYYFGWGSVYYPLMGYASQLIVEDKARTAQEISDYYNQTKGNYGL